MLDREHDCILYKFVKRGARPNRANSGRCQIASIDPRAIARARLLLPAPVNIAAAAERLGALGHPARLSLLLALEERELCVCDCAQVLGGTISATSIHLKELRQLGAITFRNAGRMAYYRLLDPRWVALARAALSLLDPHAADKDIA